MMFNTVNTKADQLTNGYFQTGSGDKIILIVGSCRSVPYLGYLSKYNEENNNPFTITFIDPFNFNYDRYDNRVDMEANIISLETNENILNLFKNTDIAIHEFYSNFGMFNFDKNAAKNIYKFGLDPINALIPLYGLGNKRVSKLDICIPNFNDLFILFKDIVSLDIDIRKKVIADINVTGKPSDQTLRDIFVISQNNLNKFYEVCAKSDMPEMAEYFENNFKKERLFWTSNHVSKNFTSAMFNFINDKYLGLKLPNDFYDKQEDIFANNYTYLTQYDLDFYGYTWDNEELKPIL